MPANSPQLTQAVLALLIKFLVYAAYVNLLPNYTQSEKFVNNNLISYRTECFILSSKGTGIGFYLVYVECYDALVFVYVERSGYVHFASGTTLPSRACAKFGSVVMVAVLASSVAFYK